MVWAWMTGIGFLGLDNCHGKGLGLLLCFLI
jgi:hypothetical protein